MKAPGGRPRMADSERRGSVGNLRVRALSSAIDPSYERRISHARNSVSRRVSQPSQASVLQQNGWSLSEDDLEAVVVKVDQGEWQIGFSGEDAPRDRTPIQEWGGALDPGDHPKATALLSNFLKSHCDGMVPNNVMLVISSANYCGREEHFKELCPKAAAEKLAAEK